MRPESNFQIAPNWPEIVKMTMTSQFADMASSPNLCDVVLLLLSSLVTGPSFWSYENFLLQGINQKSGNWKYPRLSFAHYLETGVS